MFETIANRDRVDTSFKPTGSLASGGVRPAWLTYREAEVLTGLSRVTIWKLIKSKGIKAAKVGRAVRISRRSLEAYMEECATDAC